MAIFNLFECTVLVDGAAVEEYDNDDDEQQSTGWQHINKYIEAISGANFILQSMYNLD